MDQKERVITDKFQLVPFLRIIVAMVLGIVCGYYSLVLSPLLFFRRLSFLRIYVIIIIFGAALSILHSQRNFDKYDISADITATVEKQHNDKGTVLKILSFDSTSRYKGVKFVCENDPIISTLNPGDTLRTMFYIESIKKEIVGSGTITGKLKDNGYKCYAIVVPDSHIAIRPCEKERFSLIKMAKEIQDTLSSRIMTLPLPKKDAGILMAIITGDRDMLSYSSKQTYTRAGVSHIIAISGLHVGIIFFILNIMMSSMNFSYHTRLFRLVIIVTALWGYALITGLAPSVCRATLMFSLLQLSFFRLNSQMTRYNILFASAFCLLCINPFLIYDIGFQMSYISVFSIIFIIPKITKRLDKKRPFLNYFISIIATTIAVQIFLAPLVVYYFKGMPLFPSILSNMVTIIMIPPIIILSVLYVATMNSFVGSVTSKIFELLNIFIDKFASLQYSYIDNIVFTKTDLIISYVAIAIMVIYIFVSHEDKEYEIIFKE